MGITHKIVQKCHQITYDRLSPEIVDRVKYLLLDYVGVAARGTLSESSRPVYRMLSKIDDGGADVGVIGTRIHTSSPWAALANGTAAHSLELDDVVNEASLHPAVAVNFDPANIILYDKGEPVDSVRTLSSGIKHIHIKDAIRTKTAGTWGTEVPWGEGP